MTDRAPLSRRLAALRAINRLNVAVPVVALGLHLTDGAAPFRVADSVTGAAAPQGNRKQRRSVKP